MEKKYLNDIFFHTFTEETLISLIESSIGKKKKIVIAHHNLHSLFLLIQDSKFSLFFRDIANYIHIDGMGVVLMCKIFGVEGVKTSNRLTYLDWGKKLLYLCNKENLNLYYLGTDEKNLSKVEKEIKTIYPELNIKTHHGFFNREDKKVNTLIINEINIFKTNVLLVGMSMPIQEKWIMEHIEYISCDIILPCGAFLEYYGGGAPPPPRFFGKIGLEWLYRFGGNPRKFWKRYLLEPFIVLLQHYRKK